MRRDDAAAPWLAAGLGLVLLAFWGADSGYSDLQHQIDDAMRIWGDAAGTLSHFSLGLPVLAGPLVLCGRLLDALTGGAIPARAVASATAPLLGLGGLLLFGAVLRRRGASARDTVWALLVLAVASPFFSYLRHFYAEVGVFFFLALFLWARLQTPCRTGHRFLAGLGLAGVAACHYAHALLGLGLGLGALGQCLGTAGRSRRARLRDAAGLAAAPLLVGTGLFLFNLARAGHVLTAGYHKAMVSGQVRFAAEYLGPNLAAAAVWCLRVPWLLPAALLAGRFLWRTDRRLGFALACGAALQLALWETYCYTAAFWDRFHLPLIGLAGLGLPGLSAWLARHTGTRGQLLVLLALVSIWAATFFDVRAGTVRSPPTFIIIPEHGAHVQFHAWYAGATATRFVPFGPAQAVPFACLLAAGLFCLVQAWGKTPPGEGPTQP